MAQFRSSSGQVGGGGTGGTGGGGTGGTGGGGTGGTGGGGTGGTGGGGTGGTGGGVPNPVAGAPKPVAGVQARIAQKAPPDLGPAVIAQRRLTFRIQRQQQSEWCWAAVAASVEQFFDPDPDPASRLKQCEVADMVLKDKDKMPKPKCCEDPEDCDLPAELEDALKKIYKWRDTLDVDPLTGAKGSLTFEQVKREIDRGRPVCAGIRWKSGTGHFVVVRGYRVLGSGAQQLYVADPLYPSSLVDFNEFTVAYYGEGEWTETDLVVNDWS